MPHSNTPPFFRSRARYIVSGLVCFTLVAVGAARVRQLGHASFASREHTEKIVVPQTPAQADAPQSERIEAELIIARPNGFEPTEIKRPPGPFVLAIENRSGTDLGPLRLEHETAGFPGPVSRMSEALITKERLNYAERIDLPPGRYRLRQSQGRGWSLSITIAAR